MKISVIIPLYNNAASLPACIDSLALQGIDREEYEVIIVDDGSTDNSFATARDIATRWDNMRVIHQENKGSGESRNLGIDEAKGEYIHFVDADDQVMPGAYRFLFDNTLMHSPDIVYFDFGKNIYTESHSIDGRVVYSGAIRDYVKSNHVRPYAWIKLHRRDFLLKHHLRFPSLRTRQDIVFNWDMLRHDGTMVVTDAQLYSYTINPSGATYGRDVKHIKMTVENLVKVNEKLKGFATDFVGYDRFTRVCNYNYHVLFNRILCSPYTLSEIRELFPRCAAIGTGHISKTRQLRAFNFIYHHPLMYHMFQNLIMKVYFKRYPIPENARGDMIDHRLKNKQENR